MTKITRIHKLLVFGILFSLVLGTNLTSASNSSSGDVVEISQIVQDVNGIGIVLKEDISGLTSTSSFLYILIGLNQEFTLNGLYIVGFDSTNDPSVNYKLGDPYDPSLIWFSSSSSLILNYGSVIYVDILDYLIAFGTPDEVNALVLLSSYSFTDMELNINTVLSEYESSLVSVDPNLTTTSSNTNTKTIITETNSTNSTATSDKGINDILSSVPGFELPLLMIALLIPLRYRKIKN
jgi:hypothetical protein